MSQNKLAAPELAAIEIHGLTRQSFIARGAVAAGALVPAAVGSLGWTSLRGDAREHREYAVTDPPGTGGWVATAARDSWG